jgi:hypothetical protein
VFSLIAKDDLGLGSVIRPFVDGEANRMMTPPMPEHFLFSVLAEFRPEVLRSCPKNETTGAQPRMPRVNQMEMGAKKPTMHPVLLPNWLRHHAKPWHCLTRA